MSKHDRKLNAIKVYTDYWDNWHREWFINSLNMHTIKGWGTPSINDENEIPIWRYFPEPYWGNPNSEKLVSVFLNLNPGGGGDCQDVLSINNPASILYKSYVNNMNLYSKTIEQLSKDLCYTTTNWFDKKRSNWLNKLLISLDKNGKKAAVENILCADLIPWHTYSVTSEIKKYIVKHTQLIFDNVILPITSISQEAVLKGIVFAKGRDTSDMLECLKIDKINQYKNGKFEINLFKYNNAVIIVFVGGQGIYLPNPCEKKYQSENKDNFSISDIIKEVLF